MDGEAPLIKETQELVINPKFLLGLVGLLVLAVVGLGAYVWTGGRLIPQKPSTATAVPVQTPNNATVSSIDTCSLKKDGNPLIDFINKDEKSHILAGTFTGNVLSVQYDAQTKSSNIELISTNGQQQHHFAVADQEGLMQDIQNKGIKLSEIKVGMGLTMSFNCVDGKDTRPRIVHILVTKIR